MPSAHSSDLTVAAPTGPPMSRPRSASVRNVIGLTFTKACSQPGIVVVGTSTLLPNTSGNMPRDPNVCTACGVFSSSPMSAESQHMDTAKVSSSRQPPSADSGLVSIRNPRTAPNPMVTAIETT